ncbi:MAG: hypothetical protein GY773_20585, partial [Actinomycetia bacterium]|nr:hypothetical protein [Actinomycetes bacterium]
MYVPDGAATDEALARTTHLAVGAQVFVPDGLDEAGAIARATHMAIGAHQDDIPIMAHHGILECFGQSDRW